tara:strand:+ start:994 stop:1146 length:153 start_codon:yes stop_codon:yes gene_type:complete
MSNFIGAAIAIAITDIGAVVIEAFDRVTQNGLDRRKTEDGLEDRETEDAP